MARSKTVPGEKALFWVASAHDDLMDFPDAVKDAIGEATEAQLRELTELQLAFIGGGIGDTAI